MKLSRVAAWLVCLLSFIVCRSSVTAAAETAGAGSPNFVFVLIDDLGWSDLACYGNSFAESPRIDALAAAGMRFTDAYAACPVCSPTRASLMTGRYPATVDLTDFISGHWRPWAKLVVPKFQQQLPLGEFTLGEGMKSAGYTTGYFGKWHLGGPSHYPDKQGFDVSLVSGGRHFGFNLNGKPRGQSRGSNQSQQKEEYLAERLTDESLKFLEANCDRPFLLYLAHYAVHIPLEARQELIQKYQGKAGNKQPMHPTYAAMIEHVDQSVGRLLDKLDELKLSERTVVVFFSDNGGLTSRFDAAGPVVTTNAPLRAEKGTVYEGGIRVPMIVRWPGVVSPGSVCREPVSSVDLLPTLLEIAGAPVPNDVRLDGMSLTPLLRGEPGFERQAIYWHYPHYHHMDPAGAIRAGDMKLIEHFEDGRLELYNLKTDIGERHDLAASLPDQARKLQSQLAAWRQQVGAKLPTENPNYDPQRAAQWGNKSNRPSVAATPRP